MNRYKDVEGDDAQGNSKGLVVRREGNESFGERELQPAIKHQADHVQGNHEQRESTEITVQILQPRRVVDSAHHTSREQNSPEH